MLISLLVLLLLTVIVVFILYINEKIATSRYTKAIEDINNKKVFNTESIKLTSNNRVYMYQMGNNEVVYCYNVFKLDNDLNITEITLNVFVSVIKIDIGDYDDAKCIYGNIVLKHEIS